MLFNSFIFIFVFLPITFYIYFYFNHKKYRGVAKVFLVFSSLFFYAWWNVIYVPIIILSVIFNYYIGKYISQNVNVALVYKKRLLIFGIAINLLVLGYFKYTDFFIENINRIISSEISLLHLSLPLAISFFTFQQIAYLVDSYRGETKTYSLLDYCNFVTFFPQLIAGPIVHHSEMMQQFRQSENKIINYKNIALGLFLFSIGLFKKVVIADTFAVWVHQGFDLSTTLGFFEAWATSLSYTFQLYFDFSGYTDMALGTALLFNIKLPVNFNSPYKALDIQDFWRRWHITLSRFLKEYIYIPLGGNRKGKIRTYLNLFITFVLGGIWHGAGWTFVFWGILHGGALVIHRIWQKIGIKLPIFLAWFLTFNFINIAWVFFRAKNWDDAVKVFSSMFDMSTIGYSDTFISIYNHTFRTLSFMMPSLSRGNTESYMFDFKVYFWIIVVLYFVLKCKNSYEIVGTSLNKVKAIYFAWLFLFSLLSMSLSQYSEFIYFNF